MTRTLAGLLGLVLAGLIVGCAGGGASGSGASGAGGGIRVIFSDDFSSGSLNPNFWAVTSPGGVDRSNGNPAPSAFVTGGASITFTGVPFNTGAPVTISVDAKLVTITAFINVFDVSNGTVASVGIEPTLITYTIQGGSTSIPVPPDANFHTFMFSVDSSLNARWFRDGQLRMGPKAFPVLNVSIGFVSGRTTAGLFGDANFDNVKVTTP